MALRVPQTYIYAGRTVPKFRSIGQITLSGYGVNRELTTYCIRGEGSTELSGNRTRIFLEIRSHDR